MRKLGVLILAAVLFSVPTMACLLPAAELTAAERECCKQMAGQCGKAGMGSSHSCCQRLATSEDLNFVKAEPGQLPPDFGAFALHVPAAAQSVFAVKFSVIQSPSGIHGPPEWPPTSISVLRI